MNVENKLLEILTVISRLLTQIEKLDERVRALEGKK